VKICARTDCKKSLDDPSKGQYLIGGRRYCQSCFKEWAQFVHDSWHKFRRNEL
jgi:hypothetical protein